ncbi:hypothetical protein G5B95_08370 [Campylobacter concisus]|uniref:hypothetical protein n=1 Tax=Campylobacter concisus TaxID=199 RepID=UPI0018AC6A14|nr:hypothetical protein [Campylobacter concisus]QPI03661.1 hypothetical protein G5B95_08370 [Campylobacter concisus]
MDKTPLEKVEVVFFMIIKNLEAMGLMNFLVYTIFVAVLYGSINSLVCSIEKAIGVATVPRWYDIIILTVFILSWVYGIYIYKKWGYANV